MYGYPEQFIPQSEIGRSRDRGPVPAPATHGHRLAYRVR